MDQDTIIIRIKDGHFAGFECAHPAIRRAAIVTDGHFERIAGGRLLASDGELAVAKRVVRGCIINGAWSGLDDAGSVAAAALTVAADVCAEVAELLADFGRPSQPASDLEALLTVVIRTHNRRIEARELLTRALQALHGLDDAQACAAAAHDGHHQQPLIEIEGDDYVRH